jgi:hypothetical protein
VVIVAEVGVKIIEGIVVDHGLINWFNVRHRLDFFFATRANTSATLKHLHVITTALRWFTLYGQIK